MDECEEAAFLMCVLQMCYLTYKISKRKNRRRWWVRPLYQKRKSSGFFETTFQHIKDNDEELFFKATRMTKLQYNLLLSSVKNDLSKFSRREAIDPECRLVVTLMYLSQGVSPNYLAWTFRMGVSTVRQIIIEVCATLWRLLSVTYMKELNSVDWQKISQDFNNKWQMPNCIGSIDGKHVQIKCPPNSGSKFFNYKGHFSIVLLGVCDANYIFSAVDVGAYGSQSDGGVFRNSIFGKKFSNNEVNLPAPTMLPNSEKVSPYYLIGDNAFPLRKNLMRPYPGILLEKEKEVFNYRLSRARRIVENAFGILTTRWRILGKSIEFHPENADKIILACVILHNFIKTTDSVYNCNTYCPQNFCDFYNESNELIEGGWRQDAPCLTGIGICRSNSSTREAFLVRENLTQYFMNEGKVSFQPQ